MMEIISPHCSKAVAYAYGKSVRACKHAPTEIQLPLQQRPKRTEPHRTGVLMQPIKPPTSTWRKTKMNSFTTINTATAAGGRSTTSDVLRLMDALRLPIPPDIYASLVKECTDTRDAVGAAELHAHIAQGFVPTGLPLLNRFLLMYVACGCTDLARQLFDQMSPKDSISWATMIAGSAHNGLYEEAIGLFLQMLQHHGNMLVFPSGVIVCLLKACVHTVNLGLGKQVHGWLLKAGYTANLFLSSSLINFYGRCRCLPSASYVFDRMHRKDTVAWTASIVNNCREEHFEEVLSAFNEMGRAGIKKNSYTFSSVLRACGRMQDEGWCGRQVHANTIKHGVDLDNFVQCGLVDMYGKRGLLEDARRVFEMISDKGNTALWNAMLAGYIRHGFCIEALKFLYRMKAAGVQPQESLLNEVRIACGSKTPEKRTDGICE